MANFPFQGFGRHCSHAHSSIDSGQINRVQSTVKVRPLLIVRRRRQIDIAKTCIGDTSKDSNSRDRRVAKATWYIDSDTVPEREGKDA